MKRVMVMLALSLAVAAALIGLGSWLLHAAGVGNIHAYLAMGLGVVATAVIGGGLMALAFHSSRAGYDDEDRQP